MTLVGLQYQSNVMAANMKYSVQKMIDEHCEGVLILKIRQMYVCGNDVLCIKFIYNSIGAIIEAVEIDNDSEFEEDELAVPNTEVTREFFNKVVNNPSLK